MGDTFDRRKFINFVTLAKTRAFYFDEMAKRGIEYHAVVGNHDTSYKNTNEVNSLSLLCKEYNNFHEYITEPKELEFGGTKFMLAPWITKENEEISRRAFGETKANILAGHFEFSGFEMMRGVLSEHGLDRKDFSRFHSIWSGHFHHPSVHENINYLGAPYEMTWTDFNGLRGFHVYDTFNQELTRIVNPFRMFHKIYYNDAGLLVEDIQKLEVDNLKNAYVKIIVNQKNNPYIFELFMDKLQSGNPADLKIVEDSLNLEKITEEELKQDLKLMYEANINFIRT